MIGILKLTVRELKIEYSGLIQWTHLKLVMNSKEKCQKVGVESKMKYFSGIPMLRAYFDQKHANH